MASTQESALKLVAKKFASMDLPSVYWPAVEHKNLQWEIESRIKDPDRIWQSQSNLCGMATFFNTLAWDDPYLYAFYVCEMYRCGAAYLGYGKSAPLVKTTKATRSSKPPPAMPAADWVALASLRDHLNGVLDYSFDAGIPVLKDIPLLGFLGSPKFAEPLAGITWPSNLENMLKAVGYTKVVNKASVQYSAGPKAIDDANAYLKAGYRVLVLIHTGIYSTSAGTVALSAEHWVRLVEPIAKNGSSVRARVYDPADGRTCYLPDTKNGAYLHRNSFNAHFYGFIAAKK